MGFDQPHAPIIDAVVLLAGAGSRLATMHGAVPKPLVEVCGVPLISYVLQALESAGIRNVHAVVGANAQEVIAGVESCLTSSLTLNAIHNREWQKQNGISVLSAARAVDRPFLLTMGDHLFDRSILQVLLECGDHSQLNLAVDHRIETIFDLNDAMKVQTERGAIVEIGKNLAKFDAIDTGLFLCPLALFDYLEQAKVDGDCSLADGVRLMAHDRRARAIDIGERWWQDVDTPAMLRRAEECLLRAPQLVAE
ncbi:MAG: phosphocholine cytidylyltransferase family protein [Chthoniobacterales bacterium]